jgi:hypothetical protein
MPSRIRCASASSGPRSASTRFAAKAWPSRCMRGRAAQAGFGHQRPSAVNGAYFTNWLPRDSIVNSTQLLPWCCAGENCIA